MSFTNSPAGASRHLCLRLLADRVERHTGEHIDEICPYVPILDVPVPQSQFLEVPGCAVSRRASYRRAQDPRRQSPATLCGSRFSRSAHGGTVGGSANRFDSCRACRADRRHPNSAWPWFSWRSSRQSSTASVPEQIVEIPVGEGLQDFLPDLHSGAPFAFSRVFFFRTFLHGKKSAEVSWQVGTGVVADSSSSTMMPCLVMTLGSTS